MGPESKRIHNGPEHLVANNSGIGCNGMAGWQLFCQSEAPKCVVDAYRKILCEMQKGPPADPNDFWNYNFAGCAAQPPDHRGCRYDVFGYQRVFYDVRLRNNGKPITGPDLWGQNGVLQRFYSDSFCGLNRKASFVYRGLASELVHNRRGSFGCMKFSVA